MENKIDINLLLKIRRLGVTADNALLNIKAYGEKDQNSMGQY